LKHKTKPYFSLLATSIVFFGFIACKQDSKIETKSPVLTAAKAAVSTEQSRAEPEVDTIAEKLTVATSIDNGNSASILEKEVMQSSESKDEIVTETTPKVNKSSKPKPAPRLKSAITFEKIRHDFGAIMQGDTVDYNFVFRNTGKGPLVINSVKVTCGCTQPSYPFIPVESGEEGFIGVKYISVGKEGSQKPLITVFSNASKEPVTLMLSGQVDLPVDDLEEKKEAPTDSLKTIVKKDTIDQSK